MRPIEFNDSFSRSQNIDKLQSRDLHKPADDVALATQKQALADEEKKMQVQTSEEARDKLVNKDKEEREKHNNKKGKKEEQQPEEQPVRRKSPRGGFFLVDIDA